SRPYVVRRATKNDLGAISVLFNSASFKWFGNIRPKFNAIKTIFTNYQTHRLLVIDANSNDLLAYAEFRNYPAISALPSDSWLEWLYKRYCLTSDISWINCLFFNFCIYSADHPEAIVEVAREVFYIDNRILYLITVRVPDRTDDSTFYQERFDDLEKFATGYYPREFSLGSNRNTQMIFIIERFGLLPKITYRRAMPEDNDDIIEMHSYEFPELREELGDFYIAEELLRQDEEAKNNILIVSEVENDNKEITTSGFLWLESEVDIRYMVKCYDLEIFGNLLKFNPNRPYAFETAMVTSVERKAEARLFTVDAMDDLEGNTILGGIQRNDSGVSVASWSKVRVDSINGTIADSVDSTNQNKFYMREVLYRKFLFIFEKLIRINYYINAKVRNINLFFNTDQLKKFEDGVQTSSNAFGLRYICTHPNFPIERLFNSLVAMFSVFPDRDYCIMTIQKSGDEMRTQREALNYLRTFFLQPVAQRPTDIVNLDEIYITHRSTIYGELSLYRMEARDVETIQSLAVDAGNNEESRRSSYSYNSKVNTKVHLHNELQVIEQIISDALQNEDSEFDVFTIRCGNSTKPREENTTVGYVILRRFLHHRELQQNYHVPRQDHLSSERAEIISLKLHPLFNISCDVIFRNLAAQTKYFDFYYITARRKSLFTNDLKTMMMLLEPRPRKKFCFNVTPPEYTRRISIEGLPRYDFFTDHLVIFRHKLNPSKWFGNTNRVVIVGFSAWAKAILRQLLFMWNSKNHENSDTYNCLSRLQVSVISPPGKVEADYDCTLQCPYCESTNSCYMQHSSSACYIRDVTARMDLRYWVHFLSGTISYVNREKKYVKVNGSCEIFYDVLILAFSQRYCLPPQASEIKTLRRPYNLIEVNHRIDKFMLFYKFRVLTEEHKDNYRILIHGCNLDTYQCLAFLLSHGVSPRQIVLVMPICPLGSDEEQKQTNPYYDRNIQYILEDMLEDLDVEIHRDLNFSRWIQHGATNFIIEVMFIGAKKQELFFDCDLFISFIQGYMQLRDKKWMLKSGILMENDCILVDEEFRTNDPDIYAVGEYIKISKPVNYQYNYVSSREAAAKLLHILGLRAYTGQFELRYSMPTFYQGILPLDYYLTKVTMPRRYMASYVVNCSSCVLTTYHDQTFCRVVLSPKLMVEEIVVVTKKDENLDYLENFCGKHETMLNSLWGNYRKNNIPCLLQFLKQPWTELVMHEDFEEFQAENHKILTPMLQSLQRVSTRHCIYPLIPYLFQLCSSIQLSVVATDEIRLVNQHILEHHLLEFVRRHRGEFYHEFALPEDF
ncbi:hypothetical protein KR222_004808, partial [Zaprionus bogoriensis]